MKILFINFRPNIKSSHPRHILPPLDIGYCASLLEKNGNTVELIDLNIKNFSIDGLTSYINKNKNDVVVIKPAINTVKLALVLSKKIKRIVKKIVLIGPFASLYYKDFIFKASPVNLVILNEPELTLLELIRNLKKSKNINHIASIVYYNKKIILTEEKPLIKNLSSLPFPKHGFFVNGGYTFYYPVNIKKKIKMGYILSSRGCPHNCIFCSLERASYGKPYRMRTPKNIVDEMELLKNCGVNVIYFVDDNFTENKKHTIKICNEIIKRKLDLKWIAQSRVDNLNSELLVKMKKAGCSTLCLGIESGSDRILKILNKKISVRKILDVNNQIKKIGIWRVGFYIIGNPSETKEEIEKTFELAKKLYCEMIQIHFFTFYQDSQNHRNKKSFKTENYPYKFVCSNYSEINNKELMEFQKYFYKKYYLNPKFITKFIIKQGIFAALNWRKFMVDTLKFLF